MYKVEDRTGNIVSLHSSWDGAKAEADTFDFLTVIDNPVTVEIVD